MSYDCIAEAFARDTDGTFPNIHHFIGSLETNLDTIPGHELFLAYKSFQIRIAEAQLARLYGQTDPSGSRIHRNIRDCLKGSNTFTLHKDFRGVVLVPLHVDPLDHLGPFPMDELERHFVREASSRNSIPRLLEILHGVLGGQCVYRRTLPLIEVVVIFKSLFQNDFVPETSIDHEWSLDGLGEFELRRMRYEVENVLKEKILLTYLVRGKVTDKQAAAMFKTLQAVLDDWFSGNSSSESLYSSFNGHLPIGPGVYEQDFRPKMEYLLRLARQELAGRLMREM